MKQQILDILDKSTNNGMKADEIVSLIQDETFANLDEAAKYMVSVIAVKDMATVNEKAAKAYRRAKVDDIIDSLKERGVIAFAKEVKNATN